MDTDGFMAKNPLFTRDDWMSFRRLHAEASTSSAEQLFKYYVGKQRLIMVVGAYALKTNHKAHDF